MSATANAASNEERCLWIPRVTATSSSADDRSSDVSSYETIYRQFAVKPESGQRSLFRYVANTIVVLQEFVLSCYFFGWHRYLVLQQDAFIKQIAPHQSFLLDLSTTTMYVALLLAVVFNARASAATRMKNRSIRSSTTGFYKSKVLFRIVDAVILAILLRYVAALLHDLTLSYSTDTVQLLAAASMIVHLLFCDYSYANGFRRQKGTTGNIASRSFVLEHHEGTRKQFLSMENHRPSFIGGTMSLNAAFFATVLLISRFEESGSVTSTSSFTFVSLSIILFAFYPVARHTISVIYPPHRSAVHWLITVAATISTGFLLHLVDNLTALARLSASHAALRNLYVILFLVVLLVLGLIIPMWKHYMAQFKVLLRGPWDIPSKASMNLEYTCPSSSF